MATMETLEKLNMTSGEIERLSKAFQNEEFRKLFKEYADEIADPENRKRYEEELAQLEREKGMDVEFVHPAPGYVIKTTVNGDKKAFINICKNEKIEKPSSHKAKTPEGSAGLQWSIPHSFTPPRDDVDKAGKECQIFDVVFHPDTYRMAESNVRFKKMVNDTAIEGIQKQFNVILDVQNVKFPKLTYKGTPTATIIRKKNEEGVKKLDADDLMNNMSYPYSNKDSFQRAADNEKAAKERSNKAKEESEKKKLIEEVCEKEESKQEYTTPKYTIVHRSELDFQEYRSAPDAKTSTRPKQLVVHIELPLIKSAGGVSLDIFEKSLQLQTEKPAKYKLAIDLPFPVDDNKGAAKFDKSKHRLTVTLEVLPAPQISMPFQGEGLQETDQKLVEEISENGLDVVKENSTRDEEQTKSTATIPKSSPSTPVEAKEIYNAPDYSYHQDEKTLNLVLAVMNVQKTSILKSFPVTEENSFQIKFASMGSGGFPMNYSLVIMFPADCFISPQQTKVDVSDENVVVTFTKGEGSRKLWENFHAGPSRQEMEEKVFLTEGKLNSQLAILKLEGADEAENIPDMKVVDMNENKVAISLKNMKQKKEPVEQSQTVEVIHEKVSPRLQSILKRSTSESSEDPVNIATSYSRENSVAFGSEDISESDTTELGSSTGSFKRSVSFNDEVDETMYKAGQSVSCLGTTLKNRKKRHMKKEQRQNERRRRRCSSGGSISDGDDLAAGSGDAPKSHPSQGNAGNQQKRRGRRGKRRGRRSSGSSQGDTSNSGSEPGDNQENGDKHSSDLDVDASKGPAANGHQDSSKKVEGSQPNSTNNAGKGKPGEKLNKKSLVTVIDDANDSDDNNVVEAEDKERTSQTNQNSLNKPETMLNWNDKTEVNEESGVENPKCAFSFSNSLMFMMDED